MDYILLVVSIAAGLTATLQKNSFSKKKSGGNTDVHFFNLISSLVCAVLFLAVALLEGKGVSLFTAGLGVVFGTVTALGAFFGMKAYKNGPTSYTNLLIMSSMVIPALSGAVMFNETVGVSKIIGIILMLIAIALSVCNKADRRASLSWLALSLSAALFTGCVGVMQKVHQSSAARDELMWFLCIAFTVSSVVSLLYVVFNQRKTPLTVRSDGKMLGAIVLCGIAVMLNNAINLYLSGVMESIIFFPTVNGASIVLLLLVSLIFLKERVRPIQWVGIAAGFVAIILLCI
ncbi:MAG: EamA family transporter [Clostridia bacterium]|nr:EamA family transporter [Clostridia bacterium]